MVVRAECDEVARAVCLPKWDDKDCGDYVIGGSVPADFKFKRPQVVLKPVAVTAVQNQGMITPTDSPRQQTPEPSKGPSKLKQAPLSFAPAPVGTPEVKKKAGRTRKPLPTMKPANRITNNFGASKTSKPTAGKSDSKENLFPGLVKTTKTEPVKREQTPPKSSQIAIEIPYNRHETISPKGRLPSGMANLLD